MLIQGKSWSSYLIVALAAITLSWLNTGCRFGNKVTYELKDDGVTGLYGMQAQNVQFCFQSRSTLQTTCVFASVGAIPTGTSQIMTHPVYLQYRNSQNPQDLIAQGTSTSANRPSLAISIYKNDKAFGFNDKLGTSVAMHDTNCLQSLDLDMNGNWDEANKEKTPHGSTRGRISMDFEVLVTLTGTCDSTLNTIQACYQDFNQCGGASEQENQSWHNFWHAELETFIDVGAFTEADITDLAGYGFRVEYQ